MSSVSPIASRETVVINFAYEPTHTMETIRVERKPARRSPFRRVLRALLIFTAGAVALFVAAGIVGTINNHPAVPFKTSIIKTAS